MSSSHAVQIASTSTSKILNTCVGYHNINTSTNADTRNWNSISLHLARACVCICLMCGCCKLKQASKTQPFQHLKKLFKMHMHVSMAIFVVAFAFKLRLNTICDCARICVCVTCVNHPYVIRWIGTSLGQRCSCFVFQVLATGLSGLYSDLPTSLDIPSEDWYSLERGLWATFPELVSFLRSLEFCNNVIQVFTSCSLSILDIIEVSLSQGYM